MGRYFFIVSIRQVFPKFMKEICVIVTFDPQLVCRMKRRLLCIVLNWATSFSQNKTVFEAKKINIQSVLL